jgi:hypothetical protein
MKGISAILWKKSLFFAGLMTILLLISVPVTAEVFASSDSNDGSGSGLSSAFLSGYSSSGLTLPKSPGLGTTALLSGYPASFSFGAGTTLPGTGSNSGTLGLISSALNNYKTAPVSFKDFSYMASYIPTCYGV